MNRKTTLKIVRISGIVIASIAVIITGVLIYIDRNAESIAGSVLEKELNGSELSEVYDISYGNISLGLFSGNLIIKDIRIVPKDSFFEADDSLRFKYPAVYDIMIPKLVVKGISENFSFQLENIQLEQISISRPSITMINYLSSADRKKAMKFRDAAKSLPDTAKGSRGPEEYEVSYFSIKDGSFKLYDKVAQHDIFSVGRINVEGDTLRMSPLHVVKNLVQNVFASTEISIAEIKYPVPGGFYELGIGEIATQAADSGLLVKNLQLIPLYPKGEFGKKSGKQTDRMDLNIESIEISGIDVEKLLLNQGIFISNIGIDGLYLNDFRDKSVPMDLTHFPKLPQQTLAAIDMDVNIGKIEVRKSKILYEELHPGFDEPGSVLITNFYGTLTGITNMPEMIAKNGPMTWNLQANFFDAGLLELQVLFPKNLHNPEFSFTGRMGEMDMTAFNSILENTENIRIDHGYIKSMTFEADAGEDYAEGTLVLAYDSLLISGLKKIREKEREEMGFLSTLANMIIRKFNPGRHSLTDPDPADMFFARDKNKSIFNYMAKSLVSGLKATVLPTVGSEKKRYERQEEKQTRKEEREQKREQRKQKREDKKKDKN